MQNMVRSICVLLLLAAIAVAQPNTLSPKEAQDGWVLLFDGDSLFGWTSEGKGQWHVADGTIVGDAGGDGWLRQNSAFGDYILRIDFRTEKADTNSGIFLRSALTGEPHVTGYELQIWDNNPKFPTGSLVNFASTKAGHVKAGEWQTYEIEAMGDHFVVRLDGKQVLDAHEGHSLAGHLGLQHKENNRIEFRNIKLKPLGLKPLFNGKDLSGWKRVERPTNPPKELPEWTVRDGMLHVEKGPGQVESEQQFDDFVLQLDIRANSTDPNRHPNSGVFLRGTPGVFWSGYESQIRNEYENGDRTKPVDFGTGAIYRNQPTRKVVGNDNEFFTKTIVARGRHIAVWVNGYPVTDWEDTKPEGTNVRNKEAVLKPGVISLQAHDPTTNLDFKNIRIAALAKSSS
jgi:hypothetical protein